MEELEETQNEPDPFSPTNAPGLSLVVQLRIYDVLMALLAEANEEVATELLELHATGALAGPAPAYIGKFLADEINP